MRKEVEKLLSLGAFPAEAATTADQVKLVEQAVAAIHAPVTDDEAVELVKLFGPDTYFGLAWTLLHLVETAPSWPIESCLPSSSQLEWIVFMRQRAKLPPR